MPSITFGGINTGLPPNLVDQMIDAERQPVRAMQAQKAKSENRLKLVNELDTKISDIRGKLGELANSKGFTDIKLTSGDPTIVTGTVDPSAATSGSWMVEVEKLPDKAAALTNGFPDKDTTQIGIGYFRFRTPDGNKNVYINASNNTLDGAAKAINAAKVGVRASVLNDRKDPETPFKLVLAADGSGQEKSIDYPTLYFLDGDQDIYFDTKKEGTNGLVKIDGFEFEVSDTQLKDLVPGVTLDLHKASIGNPINITVKEDMDIVSGKVKSFVDSFNAVLSFIQTQNKLDKTTDTSSTLGGDGMLRSIENNLRQLIQSPQYGVAGTIKVLNQIGITFNRAGVLEFDQKRFDGALGSKPEDVHRFLVGDGFTSGFLTSLKREINNLTNSAFGPITTRKKGLQEKIQQTDERIEQKEKQLTKKEEMLRDKFSKLEETMSRLKSQGGAVAALGGGGFQGQQLSRG